MRLFKKKDDIQRFIRFHRQNNKTIGFVPTMGGLHPGHISLLKMAQQNCNLAICSIFVNPTQFNDQKDLEKYPRTIEKDIVLLNKNGCDAVFFPDVAEIYPDGTDQTKHFEIGNLEFMLEGNYRPGHFQGVADVVNRLFHIVKPDAVFFGAKDLQQSKVVEWLIHNTPEFDAIKMHIVPTLREASMLAMSSRNTRLTTEQLAIAPVIYKTLTFIKENLKKEPLPVLREAAIRKLTDAGLKPDYVSIVDKATLKEVAHWNGSTLLSALIAAYLGEVRLIDNIDLTA